MILLEIRHAFASPMKDEPGQDLIEYALVAGLIGLGAVVAMTGLPGKISNACNAVGNGLTDAMASLARCLQQDSETGIASGDAARFDVLHHRL